MKLSILFVDDDVNLLRALKRILRQSREEWDLTFLESPKAALALMETQSFDVVVSDMRMPEMDGATLLSEVEKRHPATMRVILSGYTEEKSVLRTIGPTHQYLAKPCKTEDIVSLLDRAVALRGILRSPGLRSLAASLHNLPTPSELFLRLTQEMRREESSLRTVADIISEDMAMTAEVLRITNSAYFSLGSKIHDVFQAVRLLGTETVRALVFSVGIFRQIDRSGALGALLSDLDAYGIAVAGMARRLAREDGMNEAQRDQAFCAGMLASIGTLVFFDADAVKVGKVILRTAEGEAMDAVERELFGASQAEIGAYLLGLWGFNDAVIEAVLYQNEPSLCLFPERSPLTYVHLARIFGPDFPLGGKIKIRPVLLDVSYVRHLGMEDRVERWTRLLTQAPDKDSRR